MESGGGRRGEKRVAEWVGMLRVCPRDYTEKRTIARGKGAGKGIESLVNITSKIYDISGTIIGGWLHPWIRVGWARNNR